MSTRDLDVEKIDYEVSQVNRHPLPGARDVAKVEFSHEEKGVDSADIAYSFLREVQTKTTIFGVEISTSMLNPNQYQDGEAVYMTDKTAKEAEETVENYLKELR